MPSDTQATTRARASEELRQAALEQFATVGFAASSLQQIADHAGYAKSSVLYHYASKEALLEAAIGPAIDELEQLLGSFAAGGGDPEARAAFIARFVDFLLANRLAVHTFVNQGQSMRGTPVVERANAAIRVLAAAICDGTDLVEQLRFGVALAGAAYCLVAGATFAADDEPPLDAGHPESEKREALVAVLTELMIPARPPAAGR